MICKAPHIRNKRVAISRFRKGLSERCFQRGAVREVLSEKYLYSSAEPFETILHMVHPLVLDNFLFDLFSRFSQQQKTMVINNKAPIIRNSRDMKASC